MFRRIITRRTVLKVCVAYMLLVIVIGLFNFHNSANEKIKKANDGPIEAQTTSKIGIINGWKKSASDDQLCGYQV